ncbi:MAG TPA: Sip1-related alpha-galactosidase, partial [Armatimonadota bacterium]|nr:Sip1-related alpha-galactosidase [Armatimonadota bacterium]
MILDDGWQSVRDITTGGKWLTSFEGSEKFPQGIVPTIHAAKEQYGLTYFFAWHPIQGYFGGVDGNAFPQYRIRNVAHQYGLGIKHYNPNVDRAFGHVVGFVEPTSINQFLQDYHRHLRLQGVDGIKADSQAFLESMGAGYGGRVEMMQCYHDALEGSVNTHFLGRLINCMSCSTDMLYTALSSSVTRTSGDFMPAYNAAHQGLHIYKNALASFFAGEFIQPDWDMFQSNHPTAVLHAVARAISGGPVYVSDKPDGHDFAILQKLVLSDGSIPRAHGVGRPTADCLFHDPTQENVLLKIFNVNEQAGVVGVFNVRDDNDGAIHGYIRGTVSPQDIDGLAGEMFAVYRHTSKELTTIPFDGTVNISLANFSCDVITIVPIIDGIAPIGLTEKYNCGGTIIRKGVDPRGGYSVDFRDGGEFLAWRVQPPTSVLIDENTGDFDYDVETGALRVQITEMGQHTIRILD